MGTFGAIAICSTRIISPVTGWSYAATTGTLEIGRKANGYQILFVMGTSGICTFFFGYRGQPETLYIEFALQSWFMNRLGI